MPSDEYVEAVIARLEAEFDGSWAPGPARRTPRRRLWAAVHATVVVLCLVWVAASHAPDTVKLVLILYGVAFAAGLLWWRRRR